MVFNSPTMQQQYHTRINVNGGEAAPIPPPPVPPVARPSVPPSHPPPNSFVQFTSTSVNGPTPMVCFPFCHSEDRDLAHRPYMVSHLRVQAGDSRSPNPWNPKNGQ